MKNKIIKALVLSCIVFVVCFGYYVLVSNGLGNKPFYLQLRRFIPMSILLVATVSVLSKYVTKRFFYSYAVVSALWMLVYPIAYKLTYYKNTPFFSNHFDIVFAIYSFIGLTSMAVLLSQRISVRLNAGIISCIQFLMLLLPIFQLAYIANFQSCVSEAAVTAIYQTNLSEAKEFVLMTIGYTGVVLGGVLLVAVFVMLYRQNYSSFADIAHANFSKSIAVFLVVVAIGATGYAFGNSLRQTGIMTVAINVHNYFKAVGQFNEYHNEKYAQLQVTKPKATFAKPGTIIYVIGECASRTFMSAYNPAVQRDTTPWLRSQLHNPNFIIFSHAYTSRVQTVPALERALTEKNQYNSVEFNKSITVIDMAKKAGYYTSWYSNQGTIDEADTPITLVGRTADTTKWTNEDAVTSQYDGTLLKYLQEVDPTKNNFIVLHFMGSHDNYQNRYPREFAKWGNPDINEPIIDYDNSLYYSDYVLSQVYAYAKEHLNLQAMVYMSDHGTVPDWKRHPDKNPLTANRIPLFVYLSDEYKNIYPETTAALLGNKDKYFTNDLAYELLCGIMNIKSPNYDETQSLASDKYKYTRETLRTNLGTTPLTDDVDEH